MIDLNRTSPAVLKAVLSRLGVLQAEPVANAIVDFRDQDESQFGGGGEEINLVANGPGLKNAAFQSVDELAQAVPENFADLSALQSLFTVYSLQDGIDPSVAPAQLKALVETSSSSGAEGSRPLATPSPRKAFSVDVQVKLGSGVSFRRLAMITLLRLPERPFAVLEWRQGGQVGAESQAAVLGLSCAALGAP